MKIAIVHDDLMRRGGAEQVALSLIKAFPEADIYTLCYQEKLTYSGFQNYRIHTSIFQYFVRSEKWMKWLFFPIGWWCMRRLKVHNYDLVLLSTTYCAKYGNFKNNGAIIAYCHQPFRLAWQPESYSQYRHSIGLKHWVFKKVVDTLRQIDFKASKAVSHYIANTEETGKRIRQAYQVEIPIPVIYPPVKCEQFYIYPRVKDYFLVVSRLEYYKKVDLVIETFNQLGLPLIIVGKGSKEKELKAMAKDNVQFVTGIGQERLAELYAKCQALVFPQEEDFGITALEANAAGRPVIAYAAGGVLNTMIPYKEDSKVATAVFFKEQTVESMMGAIHQFQQLTFDANFIREHAFKFDEKSFIKQVQGYVNTVIPAK